MAKQKLNKVTSYRKSRAEIVTSCAGLFVLIFVVIEVGCKAAAGPRPSLNESAALVTYMSSFSSWILGSVIADTFVIASMTVFLAGLLVLAYSKLHRITMAMIAGALFAIIYATITLFGDSFDAGSALNATQSIGDANVIRTLIEAHIVVFGPVGGIVLAFLSIAFAILIIESRLLPHAVAVAGFIVAALNIIAIPALFGVYHAWNNNIALLALVSCVAWVVLSSVALLFRRYNH
ncbi:hypothetical protein EPN95_00845 [Patescibacteria group bacterium]|nr:MAG: hypothetical protein EPN95_00845 [Patescibacteria group bacterium]